MSGTQDASSANQGGSIWPKLIVLAVVATIAAVGYAKYGDVLKLENLAQQESQLRAFQKDNPVLVYGLALLLYVVATGLSLPGAAVLTLVYGWYFGLVPGVILVSIASTAGATLAFLLSRYILRDTIQNRFGERLAAFNENLAKEGAFYLFTLRLIPAVPFFVINVVMGLTPLKTSTFWWVSQLGMFPGTIVYVYAGSAVPDLKTLAERGAGGVLTPKLLMAFVILGIFPIVIRKIMAVFTKRDTADRSKPDPV